MFVIKFKKDDENFVREFEDLEDALNFMDECIYDLEVDVFSIYKKEERKEEE